MLRRAKILAVLVVFGRDRMLVFDMLVFSQLPESKSARAIAVKNMALFAYTLHYLLPLDMAVWLFMQLS